MKIKTYYIAGPMRGIRYYNFPAFDRAAQQLLDQNVTRYDAMSNIPANQLNMLIAALGGTQVPTSSSQKTPTSGNWLTGAAGGALAGASLGPWGMLGGGILGGLAGS